MASNKDLAFLVLIGGKSTRFGSDKGIYEFNGKPLISYQLDVLKRYQKDIFIGAHSKEQIKIYLNKIDYKIITAFITDDREIISENNIRTPMVGIYSAFKELLDIGYSHVFVLSCDMPLIKPEVVDFMLTSSKGFDCCIPTWNNGFLEPLFAIYPLKNTLINAERNLKKGIYKLIELLDKNWKINYVSIEDKIQHLDRELTTFININSLEDLERII